MMVLRGLGVSVGFFYCFSMIIVLSNKVKYNRDVSSLQEADFDRKSAIFGLFWLS